MSDQVELQALDSRNNMRVISKHESRQKAKWTKLLAVTGIASTLGTTVPAGYAMGVVNSPAENIKIWANQTLIQRYQLALSADALAMLWSSVVSMFLVGGAIGSLGGAWAADKFGRKFTLLLSKLLLIVAAVCFFSCRQFNSVELLMLGRLLLGLASGLSISCLPMYLSEIAPLDLRGTLGIFCAIGLCSGIFLGQIFSLSSIFGSASYWHIALSFYAWLTLLALVPYKWFPESPKWLFVVKQDKKAAEFELQRLRHSNESILIAEELESMRVETEEAGEAMGFITVFKESRYALPLLLVFACQFGQQLSGINAIIYYSVSIFQRAGLTASAAEWANLGVGGLNLTMSLCGLQIMAKYGRRTLMLFSSFFCGLSILTFVIMLYFIELVSWFAMGCIACIYCYIFFFQIGIHPIPYFIAAELFEVCPRPVAMSFGSLANFAGNILVGMAFPSVQSAWGSISFMPFVISSMSLFAFMYFYMPETKARSATEVADIVAKGFSSKVRKIQ